MPRFISSLVTMLRFISFLLIASFFHDACNAAELQYGSLLASPVFILQETQPRVIRSTPLEFSAETQYNYGDSQSGVYAGSQTYITSNVNQEPQNAEQPSQSATQNHFGSNQIVTSTGSGKNNVVQVVSNRNGGIYLSSNNDGNVIYVNSNDGALHVSNSNGVVQISTSNGKKKGTMIYVNGVQVQA